MVSVVITPNMIGTPEATVVSVEPPTFTAKKRTLYSTFTEQRNCTAKDRKGEIEQQPLKTELLVTWKHPHSLE